MTASRRIESGEHQPDRGDADHVSNDRGTRVAHPYSITVPPITRSGAIVSWYFTAGSLAANNDHLRCNAGQPGRISRR
jgi:hypothetical protein